MTSKMRLIAWEVSTPWLLVEVAMLLLALAVSTLMTGSWRISERDTLLTKLLAMALVAMRSTSRIAVHRVDWTLAVMAPCSNGLAPPPADFCPAARPVDSGEASACEIRVSATFNLRPPCAPAGVGEFVNPAKNLRIFVASPSLVGCLVGCGVGRVGAGVPLVAALVGYRVGGISHLLLSQPEVR